jgi:tetratricopeptide (TPR) repeat protein/TolB-like protein
MLTASSPFKGKNALETASRTLRDDPAPLRDSIPELPLAFDQVVQKLLMKNPAMRYQSMADVRNEIRDLLGESSSHVSRIRHLPVITTRGLVAAFILLALLIAGFGALQYFSNQTKQTSIQTASNTVVILPFKNKTRQRETDNLRLALTQNVIGDLTPHRELRVFPYDRLYQINNVISELDKDVYDRKTLQKVSSVSQCKLLVQPTIFQFGEILRILVEFKDPKTGETTDTATVDRTVKADETHDDRVLFDMLPQMSSAILEKMGVKVQPTVSQAPSTPLGTMNSEALVSFNEGVNLSYQGKNLSAINFFERAIQNDPKMALAHAHLALTYKNLGFDPKAEAEAKLALSLIGQATSELDSIFIKATHSEIFYDYPSAIQLIHQMIRLYGNRPEYYYRLGQIYEMDSSFDQALNAYQRSVELDVNFAQASLQLGRLFIDRARPKEAMASFNEAMRAYSQIGNSEGKARVLSAIGHAYLNDGELVTSLNYFQQALEIDEAIANKSGIASDLQSMGTNLTNSRPYFDKALRTFLEIGDKFSAAKAYVDIGNVLLQKGKPEDATSYYKKSLAIAEEIQSKELLGLCYERLGQIYIYLSDFDSAEKYSNLALEQHKKSGSKKGMALVYSNLGDIYMYRGSYVESAKQYENALNLYMAMKDRAKIADAYGLQANLYYIQAHYGQALKYRQQQLSVFEKMQDKGSIAYTNFNLGHIYFGMGALDDALKHYEEALRYFGNENESLMGDCLLRAGKTYLLRNKTGDTDLAKRYLNEALKLAGTLKSTELSLLANGYLLQFEAKQGRLRSDNPGYLQYLQELSSTLDLMDSAKTETHLIAASIDNFIKQPNRALMNAKVAEDLAKQKGFKAELLKAECIMARAFYDQKEMAKGNSSLLAAQSVAAEIRSELPRTYIASFSVHPDYEPKCLASK